MALFRTLMAAGVLVLAAGCDPIGGPNGRGDAVPEVAPPRLLPTEILPPRIERSPVGRVVVKNPPNVDATQVDVIKQGDGLVDILWVVDDSGSMANERVRLVGNFARFLAELVTLRVDFQMGVTTTGVVQGGKLRGTIKILKNSTPMLSAAFGDNTLTSASRIRWSQGLRMTQFALSGPNLAPGGDNAGFLRPDAALAVIVVSDADDASFGTVDYYVRALKGLKGKGNENLVTFSAIVGTTPNGCTSPGDEIYYGSLAKPAFRYAEAVAKTGGVVGSICDASFEQTLVQIAQALNTLRRVFPLTLPPIAGSINVLVNGQPVPQDAVNGWQYRAETNSVVFLGTYIPPPAAVIRIEYAFAKP